MDYILCQRAHYNKARTMQSMFSDHNEITLERNNRKWLRYTPPPNIWILKKQTKKNKQKYFELPMDQIKNFKRNLKYF